MKSGIYSFGKSTPESQMFHAMKAYRDSYGYPKMNRVHFWKITAEVLVLILLALIAMKPFLKSNRLEHWGDLNAIEKIETLSFLPARDLKRSEFEILENALSSEADINVKLLMISSMKRYPERLNTEAIRELYEAEESLFVKPSLYAMIN